jgi:uncharacterized BrkB/YihY/UPF0761 family membrane protein
VDILDLTDKLWFKIAPIFSWISESLGAIFYPFMLLGPILGIACIAAVTYGITKIISKLYKSAKLERLQGEFEKLKEIRKEAHQIGDKKVCKGLDDEMDRIYFDILWASILRGSAVHSIPILAMLCWVWSYFSPDRLQAMYGKGYIIKLPFKIGVYENIGAAFWFLISLFFIWSIYKVVIRRKQKETKIVPGTLTPKN